jgi:gamma-butyrobetaine dioxygenase
VTIVESLIRVAVVDGTLAVEDAGNVGRFHPAWLLDRSTADVDVDATTRQRLYEPADVPSCFAVVGACLDAGTIRVSFSDGRVRHFAVDDLARWCRADVDLESWPAPEPWEQLGELPTISWTDVVDGGTENLRRLVGDFHRFGCFLIVDGPTDPGSLHDVAGHFGRVSPTNFGTLFDVVSIPNPSDLAYTPVGLSPHTDQPYRRPAPGLQFMHTLANDAPGGESTMTDGLAAVEGLRRAEPDGFRLLSELSIEFRYDIGSDVVINHAPIIELHPDGTLRQFRFSPRLDYVPYADVDVLERFYAARRWLAEWLADPAHLFQFKMNAGDIWVVDNHRVLHGRLPFEPAGGRRHLQGCYIDHDGPDTMWRLLTRRLETGNDHF